MSGEINNLNDSVFSGKPLTVEDITCLPEQNMPIEDTIRIICDGLKISYKLKGIILAVKKKNSDNNIEYFENIYYKIDEDLVNLIRHESGAMPPDIKFKDNSGFYGRLIGSAETPLEYFNPPDVTKILMELISFDMVNEPLKERRIKEKLNISSIYFVPVAVIGRVIGHVICFPSEKLKFDERISIQLICKKLSDVYAKKQFDKTLEREGAGHISVFNEMASAFALCRIELNSEGLPQDFFFFECNSAFEMITGLKKECLLGKTAKSIFPNVSAFWIKNLGDVAIKNKSFRFELYFKDIDKHFEVSTFSPWKDLFALIYTDITDRKTIAQQLADTSELNQKIINASVFGILSFNETGVCILANQAAAEMMEDSIENIISQKLEKLSFLNNREIYSSFMDVVNNGNEKQIESVITTPSGKVLYLDFYFTWFKSRKFNHLLMIINDITVRKEAENMLKLSEERLKLALFASNQGLYDVNIRTGDIIVSQEYARILGYSPEDFTENITKLLSRMPSDDSERFNSYYKAYLTGESLNFQIEFRQETKNGSQKWIYSHGNIVEWDSEGNPIRLIGTTSDITERKKMEQELIDARNSLEIANKNLEIANMELDSLSKTDALTGIANRRYFSETGEREWQRAIRTGGSIAIIMIDIDYFKYYNDFYGHQMGDECLKNVALAISKSVKRPPDVVARYGGEEFIIMLPDTELEGGKSVAAKILKNVELLNIEHKKSLVSPIVSVSVGVASSPPESGGSLLGLVVKADQALYKAKESGRNQFRF